MNKDMGEMPQGGMGQKMLVRRSDPPPITTARRRELLALAISIVDTMQTKTEKHERRFLFNAIENQLDDR